MDRIEIRGLRAYGTHGVYEDEKRLGQTFLVDVYLDCDLATPAASDELSDTVDYGALAVALTEAVERTRFDLIETLASHLADLALAEPRVLHAEVRVAKPEVRLEVDLDEVAVTVRRGRDAGRDAGRGAGRGARRGE